jgi:hypothetical protein
MFQGGERLNLTFVVIVLLRRHIWGSDRQVGLSTCVECSGNLQLDEPAVYAVFQEIATIWKSST